MKLSAQQQAAVEYIGTPTLVVAGAGSGKTRTLTSKAAHLIQKGFKPERILAITFTNKAAEEMKNRLVQMTGLTLKQFPWVRTYHSACLMILKTHCDRIGYTTPIQILNDYQQQKVMTEILVGRLKYDKKHVRPVMMQLSNARNSASPQRYFDEKPRLYQIPLAEVFDIYQGELKAKNAIDFDNILLLTRDLLRDHPDIREGYQNYFQYILCDEYQDTNNINEELTQLLLKDGNLFAVGDDWQSIYSFRMSNVDHFLTFSTTYRDARIFRLEQNYRSANEIVRTANAVIGNNRNRMDKECFSDIRGGLIELHHFFSDDDEAGWVARKIKSFRKTQIPYDRMAVLYRTKFCSLAFEKALRKNGIPYRMLGGSGFFERREVLDLNSYLTASLFPKDDASFDRIINTPKRGVGPGTIKKLQALRKGEMSLQDAARKALLEKLLTPKLYNAISSVIELLDEIREMRPDKAFHEVIHRIGYMAYMENYCKTKDEAVSRKENIEQLIYAASQKDDIPEYLEEAALIREDTSDEADDEQDFGVNLSTVHAAKGLEFNVVFVVACEEMLFPHWRSTETEAGLEEERRLMYVSMTRSEKYLFLSSSDYRKGNYNRRSRFLDEIETAMDLV